jgi:hypothetical protein
LQRAVFIQFENSYPIEIITIKLTMLYLDCIMNLEVEAE